MDETKVNSMLKEAMQEQALMFASMMQKNMKENNAEMVNTLKEQISDSLGNTFNKALGDQEVRIDEKMEVMRKEMMDRIDSIQNQVQTVKAAQAPPDAWANFKPTSPDTGASSSGSAAQRRESAKRRFIESADPADDPRNQRNTLRIHIKGFVKLVPPAVHRKCWDVIVSRVGEHLVGAKPKTGNFDYKFVVDCLSEAQALQAIELINGLDLEWPDIKDPTNKGSIRAHSDRSPNAKKSNKIYGEIRKMLEEFLGKELEIAPLVRTSGPRGPIYVEFPDGDAMEVLKVLKNFTSGEETLRVNHECLEPLKLNEELIKDFYKKALAMASRWE